jgi:cytoplasmic iron level regulating protein YaaA (DUF328/UPF0246 family)
VTAKQQRRPSKHSPPAAAPNIAPYTFTRDGEEYTLPSFAAMRSGLIRQIRNMDEADALYTVLEEVADERTLARIDDMPLNELAELMQAWQAHAGVSLGESRRSST